MAFPILPVAIGLAVVAATAGPKKRRRTATTLSVSPHPGPFLPPTTAQFQEAVPLVPGAHCDTGDPLTFASVNAAGQCEVFWSIPITDNVLIGELLALWEARGAPAAACVPGQVINPGSSNEYWIANPILVDLVTRALYRIFHDAPGGIWPPPEVVTPQVAYQSPYFAVMAWDLAWSIAMRELCGFQAVA